MTLMILAIFFVISWSQKILGNELTLPEILKNSPDHGFFSKYEPCSISTSRIHDAYLVEGKLAATIIKGLNNLENKKNEQNHLEKDQQLKKEMLYIMAQRSLENASSNFTDNPINALNFLTRIVKHFNPILNTIFTSDVLMKRNFHKDLSALVDRYIREQCSCWPTSNDLVLIVNSISRISSTYHLPKDTLMEGTIDDVLSFEPLSLDQAIALTHEANRNNNYEDILDWTQFLLKNTNISTNEDHSTWLSLVKINAGAHFKKNEIGNAISLLQQAIKEAKFDTKALKRDLSFYQSKMEQTVTEKLEEKNINYTNLCNLETKNNKDIGLQCFYRQIGTAWDRVKVEIISQNPPVFKYYKIIKEEEISHLFNLMKILKTRFSANHEKESIISDKRLSREMAVVWDDDHIITKYLSQRISYLTGLEVKTYKYNTKMSSSSPFQIINYGIGGFVKPHTDYLAQDKDDKRKDISVFGGDRMATWMYHLGNKVHGGQIVFLRSNITVSLEQGSGLLVFNIFKNGTVNPFSEYMECPVKQGSKWTGIKYIHENGNMFKRRCPRSKSSFFGTLI